MSIREIFSVVFNNVSISVLCLYAAAAGITSHLAYFIRGEHHMQSLLLFKLVFIVPAILAVIQHIFTDVGFSQSTVRSIMFTASFLIALWSSMLIYRVFFHPLRQFPGPFAAKLSKLWHVKMIVRKPQNYLLLDKLHHQYGDFVRTGPAELTVFTPAALHPVHGPQTKCTKAPWYDRSLPLLSMQMVRDKAVHDRRRRIWDQGFNANSLRAYEGRIIKHSKTLLEQLETHAGQTINATKWFHLFGFDVMTDIAFGKSFEMTKTGENNKCSTMAIFNSEEYPRGSNDFKKFVKWGSEQMMLRVKMNNKSHEQDVVSWFIDAYEKSAPENHENELQWLGGDSRLIIVAGSDTTSATLTYAAYELASNPSELQKLREELVPLTKNDDGSFILKDLQNLNHLNGIINETLRLHPPVPSGLQRLAPLEGLNIDDVFIPGGTTVVVPTYTVSRSARAFEKPGDFVPERWYAKPEMVKDKSAFAPFSIGAYACIGKHVALMELRIVLAMIAQDFDIEFAPGENGNNLIHNSTDTFTMSLEDMQVKFVRKVQG